MRLGSPVLEADDLSFSYGGLRVFERVSFALGAGQIAFLVGPNGAGKSTLLRCLAGWAPPETGEVRLFGTAIQGADRAFRSRVILVTDAPPFYDDLTAQEHVQLVLRANRKREAEPSALQLLERFGLAARKDAYPSSFSRGMRYKLALAMALALSPDVLLCDEPFGPLDAESVGVLMSEVGLLSDRGGVALFSTHQLPPDVTPDVILELRDGQLTQRAGDAPAVETA